MNGLRVATEVNSTTRYDARDGSDPEEVGAPRIVDPRVLLRDQQHETVVVLSGFERRHRLEQLRLQVAQYDAGEDAQGYPDGQASFENSHR